MTAAKADRTCQRCGGKRDGTKYCRSCSALVARERSARPQRRKPCPECGRPKEPGKRRFCVACWEKRQPVLKLAERDRARYKSRRQRLERGVTPRVPKVDESGNVRCATCHEYLPAEQFRTVKKGPTRAARYASQCRSCYSTYLHEHRLETIFGISLERYDELLAQQEGRCAICLRFPRTRRLSVDHQHATGEIRGLLCTRCNHKVLGSANESPSLLRRAARYLEAPPARTGLSLASLGDEADQKWRAFYEAAETMKPGDVEVCDGLVAMPLATLRALAQAGGWALVVEGREIKPSPQLAIDDMALLETTWQNARPLLTAAGYIARPEESA